MTVDRVELSNIIRNERLIGALQEHVRSQFASNNGYIGRQMHPKHSQHFALLFLFLLLLFNSVAFPKPKTKQIEEPNTSSRRTCGGSAITQSRRQSPALRRENPKTIGENWKFNCQETGKKRLTMEEIERSRENSIRIDGKVEIRWGRKDDAILHVKILRRKRGKWGKGIKKFRVFLLQHQIKSLETTRK